MARASASWPHTDPTRFAPADEDAWSVTSLTLPDLNLDGNLDMIYSASGQGAAALTAIGKSVGVLAFDAQAIANQMARIIL